jgi:two-component system phosphate regulon sensor histidine kinase PhoR
VNETGESTATRITVIDPEGVVLADSEKEPRDMENHFYRPEIFEAFKGQTQRSIRTSATLKAEMMYMSFPLRRNGEVVDVLRLSLFMRDLDSLFARFRADLLMITGVAAGLSLVLALLFSRHVSRPVRDFVRASEKVAGGDFGTRLSIRQRGEFKTFARSFNTMTRELKESFDEIRVQTEELNSILASIREALCVLEPDDRILLCNESFRKAAGEERPEGKYTWEVIRSSKFAEVLKKARESGAGQTDEVNWSERSYLANISPLASSGRCVVTLHDMTEFKNLERVKKDFVVNVSHELKTPLTAIKGFVETLEADAGEGSRPYLEIIKRNTNRLISVVGDLLVLSELEEKGQRLEKEDLDIRQVVESVFKIFESEAREKSLSLSIEGAAALPRVKADPYEIERMLINLLDNALKYTDEGGVTVGLEVRDRAFVVEVKDTGIGIGREHLPHVFERFYVADKSRSRKFGGTGLGLSIVKHIVLAHMGTVEVKSGPGEGTTFTVALPLS